MIAAIRFIWNATRGHRFAPWKSAYARWRVETYTGMRAETLTAAKIIGFAWASRLELVRYLLWICQIDRAARRRA